MRLITEITEEIQVIQEENEGKKSFFIEGVFLQSDIKNRNGRLYPFDIMNNEVKRYNENYIKNNRAVGELGHPDSSPQIHLERVSHIITKLVNEGKNFIGKAKILETPYGQIVTKLLEGGAKLGVSSRGVGSLEEKNGFNVVGNDFMLITAADIVADPSAPDAFVAGIQENAEWVYIGGKGWTPRIVEETKKMIDKTSSRKLEEAKLKAFERYLRNL